MKHSASFNRSQRQMTMECNENSWHPHDSRKFTCQSHKRRQCLSPSLISRVLFMF